MYVFTYISIHKRFLSSCVHLQFLLSSIRFQKTSHFLVELKKRIYIVILSQK